MRRKQNTEIEYRIYVDILFHPTVKHGYSFIIDDII